MSAAAPSAVVTIPAPRTSADDIVVSVLPGLYVPEAFQWLSTSSGRVALDGYSWMQAVHWVAGAGLYVPRRHRSHGPRTFGLSTVRVAQELALLFPCRPGIGYLVRRTGLSERSVEYHLGMLREAGLLAYVVRGTRVKGEAAQASEFARMIPTEFDVALGIRTVLRDEATPAYTRAMTGIAEAGRELMAKLAKQAARKVRKPRKKASKTSSKTSGTGAAEGAETVVSGGARCTPMQVGTSSSPSAGTTSLPSETTGIASGKSESSTRKKSGATARRGVNRVGRRYQLAADLIREIPWLGRASTPRIAWVIRHVADAGWSSAEVRAWLHARGEVDTVHRASGLLATLLRGAEQTVATPEARAGMVSDWRDSKAAAARRHQELEAVPQGPRSQAAKAAWLPYLALARPVVPADYDKTVGILVDQNVDLGLSAQEVADMRAAGREEYSYGQSSMVRTTITTFGRPAAEYILGAELVHRALNIPRPTRPMALARR
ncbi:winged helix-turn-helix domain-containing protein [Streptomyces sp. NPDC056883]|uniref:helix-turn-helix domain-containing protein n=1 Tax=Streptomyces sp. NPDC056883 TaxID=3345959 RepID=UPI0036A7FCF1